ncbi:hypothetical protein BWQ96_03215 [Gracilariopsis chorda]|uniref:Uncharacterized protein n=1 Tax=Gracilariopsis chorda TaxID=448386 RepID=A0A2V3IY82_9FLOR|nr:hypothetical protein BWQ96_03215 [Gracilariopsis chorda]|eukprot:PXF47025.1 hypothetical protein BWQ96_03215 [Gracilariopsis chorda]
MANEQRKNTASSGVPVNQPSASAHSTRSASTVSLRVHGSPRIPRMSNLPPNRPLRYHGSFTGFRSVPLPNSSAPPASRDPSPPQPVQNPSPSAAASSQGAASGYADRPIAGIFPGQTPPPVWPLYDALIGADPSTRCGCLMLRHAPWFHPLAVRDEDLIASYADTVNTLPGDLPGIVTMSWDWRQRIAIPVHHVRRNSWESAVTAHAAFVRVAHLRQRRAPFEFPIREEQTFDVLMYRNRGEMGYCDRLADLETFAWGNVPVARQEALCWVRPILRAEFRFLPRTTRSAFLQDFIRDERRWRARFGYFVPYQNTEIERIAARHRRGRYVTLPEWWSSLEVCWGCFVELPPVLTYLGSSMLWDPRSGLWSVVVSEWAVRVAAYILAEAYDQYRLWYIQPRVRAGIRSLDLLVPLGAEANVEEMLSLLDYIEGVDWTAVPLANAQRNHSRSGSGPGLGPNTPLAGDYIFFDPWDFRELTRAEAESYRDAPREGDPMVDNDPDDPVDAVVDGSEADGVVGGAVDGSNVFNSGPVVPTSATDPPAMPVPATAPPVAPSPTYPAIPAGPAVPVANDPGGVIAQFLREMGLSANEVTGDIAAMRDALANRLGGGPPPSGNNGQ